MDLDNSGSLSIDEFMSLPELQQNPLVQRVIDIFDTDRNGEVDFKGTLQADYCEHTLIAYHSPTLQSSSKGSPSSVSRATKNRNLGVSMRRLHSVELV